MSESSTGLLEAAAPIEDAVPETRSKRPLLLVAAAAAVAVVGVLAWFLLAGSGSDVEEGPVAAAPKPAAAAPAEAGPDQPAPPAQFDGELGRDPFAPVYEPLPDAAPGAAAGAPAAPAGVAPVVPAAPAGGSATQVQVSVKEVSATGATVTVDGTEYKAAVGGETFANAFRVYATFDNACAGLLFGDESLVMCKGDTRSLTP
jgi:hypothetical protein